MRVGLIGAGRIGAFHAQTLADHPAVTDVVVTDPLPEGMEPKKDGTVGSLANALDKLELVDALRAWTATRTGFSSLVVEAMTVLPDSRAAHRLR